MTRPDLNKAVPFLAVLGSVTALGLGTSFAKHLFPLIGSMGTTSVRVGFSALLLLALWRPWRWPLQRRDALLIVRYGVALGMMNLLFYMALRTIPFGLAVAIEFAGPLTVALLASRQRIDFLWLFMAVLGLALLLPLPLPLGQGASALDSRGVFYALAAAICWALYIVFGKRVGHLHTGQSVALGLSVAAITVAPFGILQGGMAMLDPALLLYGLGVAAVSSAIPISLEMVALKRLPEEAFGILTSMEPAVAALLGYALLHETLDARQSVAILCTMLAAAGSSCTARRSGLGAAVLSGDKCRVGTLTKDAI